MVRPTFPAKSAAIAGPTRRDDTSAIPGSQLAKFIVKPSFLACCRSLGLTQKLRQYSPNTEGLASPLCRVRSAFEDHSEGITSPAH
jgi:hypothetical protein